MTRSLQLTFEFEPDCDSAEPHERDGSREREAGAPRSRNDSARLRSRQGVREALLRSKYLNGRGLHNDR